MSNVKSTIVFICIHVRQVCKVGSLRGRAEWGREIEIEREREKTCVCVCVCVCVESCLIMFVDAVTAVYLHLFVMNE